MRERNTSCAACTGAPCSGPPASVNHDPYARALRAVEAWSRGSVEAWTHGSDDGEWGLPAADLAEDQLV